MKKLIGIGEALIDFIPGQKGKSIKQVEEFKPAVGGAPANVCGAFTKLGGSSAMITQLGQDPFGDKIVDEFMSYGIGCDYISRTTCANTSLAFVALQENGNREFSFYRKPGADMLLEADMLQKEWFDDVYALHFCSVSLGDFPIKVAHERAIEYTYASQGIISFDPNLRFPLWENLDDLKNAVLEFLPKADVVKVSDEEIEFITGESEIEKALPKLMVGQVKLVIYTKGGDGAMAFTKNVSASVDGQNLVAVDTTGAGDGFIGSFLYQLFLDEVSRDGLDHLTCEDLTRYLDFSNRFCAISVSRKGAIASYVDYDEVR